MTMKRLRTVLIATALAVPISTTGCVKPADTETLTPEERKVRDGERALLIMSIAVDKAHLVLWSQPMREKLAECKGSDDVPGCMGHFNPDTNKTITNALKAYRESADAAGSAVLFSTGDAELRTLVLESADAALALLALIPGAEEYTSAVQGVVEVLK